MKKFDNAIECLEVLADELAGAGDRGNADMLSEVIGLLEEQKQLEIPKKIINEGDCRRCSNCGSLIYYRIGRCYDCGQRLME